MTKWFREDFFSRNFAYAKFRYAKFRENKTLAKISEFTVYESKGETHSLIICLIWFFMSHQQSFSYKVTGLPGLNQY